MKFIGKAWSKKAWLPITWEPQGEELAGITGEYNLKVCVYILIILTLPSFRHTFLFPEYPACQEASIYKQQLNDLLSMKRNWTIPSYTQKNCNQCVYCTSTSVGGLRILTIQHNRLLISTSHLCAGTCRPNSNHHHEQCISIWWKRWLTYKSGNTYSFLLPITY